MAQPFSVVNDILASLSDTPLAGLAVAARVEIVELQTEDGVRSDRALPGLEEQIRILRESLLKPLKLELENLSALPELARRLGLSPEVSLVVGDEGATREIAFATPEYVQALRDVIEVLAREIDQAERGAPPEDTTP